MQIKVNRIGIALILVNSVLLVFLVVLLSQQRKNRKSGFIVNQRVFNEFLGKKELEKKLTVLRARDRVTLDSLVGLLESTSNTSLLKIYQDRIDNMAISERQLSDQYTSDIWKVINESVHEFGEREGYDLIFGAVGSGSLMYANKSQDITDEVIQFVNERYKGGN
jgi:Skp family chaperone for outer membrane proteins